MVRTVFPLTATGRRARPPWAGPPCARAASRSVQEQNATPAAAPAPLRKPLRVVIGVVLLGRYGGGLDEALVLRELLLRQLAQLLGRAPPNREPLRIELLANVGVGERLQD